MGWAISLLGGTLGQAKREPESTSTGKGLRGAADPEPDRQGLQMGPPVTGSGMLATKLSMPIPCLLLRIGHSGTRIIARTAFACSQRPSRAFIFARCR